VPKEAVTEDEFIDLWLSVRSPVRVAEILGIAERAVHSRRNRIVATRGIHLPVVRGGYKEYSLGNAVLNVGIENGVVLVGSDPHYWPGLVSTMHKAFVKFCGVLKPSVVVMNGDNSTVSRWPSIGWEKKPTVVEEIESVGARLDEIEKASPGALLVWPPGNHCIRFESRIAQVAPEYKGVRGIHLKDHFSDRWHPCWRLTVNGNVHIKHREKGGLHAIYNNVVKSGHSIITGHLHNSYVRPYTDMNGTRYGVDCGTMADRDGPQFINYTEASVTLDWRSSFAVLTFVNGKLIYPEIVLKHDENSVEWRGGLIEV
jgi:hypothetical protein